MPEKCRTAKLRPPRLVQVLSKKKKRSPQRSRRGNAERTWNSKARVKNRRFLAPATATAANCRGKNPQSISAFRRRRRRHLRRRHVTPNSFLPQTLERKTKQKQLEKIEPKPENG